ncbi:MAG: O-antigen ligase family protein, partial [Pseudomonadota bacterium]
FSLGFHSSKGGLAALLSGGNQYGISNLKGSFSGSNAFALGTAVIVFFMLMANARLEMVFDKWLLDEKGEVKPWVRHLKIAGLGAIAFSAFNVMSLHSRGSFLALAGGLFIFVAFRPNGFRRMMLILPLLGITLLVVPLPDGFSERIASAFADEEDRETSAASRPHFWGVGVNMAVSNPFGVGLGCFNEHYDRYDPTEGEWGSGRSVHSSHFQVASETGVPGAIIWILLFCSSLLQCQVVRIRSRHLSLTPAQAAFLEYNAIALICGMLTFIVGGMFYALALIELPWMMFVLSGALNRISKEMIEEAVVTERVEEESGETDAPRRSIYERHV